MATTPMYNDFHGPVSGQAGQADGVRDLDFAAWEAALVQHHLGLRCFVHEWIDKQEQILSQGAGRAVDSIATIIDHAGSSNAEVSSANDDREPSGTHLQEQTPVVAKLDAFAVPTQPMDTSQQQQMGHLSKNPKSVTRMLFEREADLGIGAMEPGQDYHSTRVLQCLGSIYIFIEGVNASLHRRFPCPLINRVEESVAFGSICALVIVLNAIMMAFAADYHMTHFRHPGNETLRLTEFVFVGIYTSELAVRIVAKKLAFFKVAWNWFDFAIVWVGWIEIVSFYWTSLTQVRLLRLLKMMKVMRVLRVMRSLREVRLLMNSLMGSMKALFWTILIITGMNFMFGVYFVQSLAQLRQDSWKTSGNGEGQLASEHVEELVNPWNSVPQAMYTLFKVSTGGVSWGELSDPLLSTGWQTFSVFVLYMVLFMFVIINAVTAVFVSSTEDYATKDSDSLLNKQLLTKELYVKQMKPFYQEMVGDRSRNGEATKSVIMNHIEDPRMISFAKSLEIGSSDLEQFVDVLSSHGKRGVDLYTFVDGCIRLRGAAKSMDLYDLHLHQQSLAKEVMLIRFLLEQRMPRSQF